MKALCTTAAFRSVLIHEHEDLFIKLRRSATTKPGRAQLRERTTVEHRLARIGVNQGHNAPTSST